MTATIEREITAVDVEELFYMHEGRYPDTYVRETTLAIFTNPTTTDSEKFNEFATKLWLWRGLRNGMTIRMSRSIAAYLGIALTEEDFKREF